MPGHVMSNNLVNVRYEVADDGWPQVTHVERFGHVRGAEKRFNTSDSARFTSKLIFLTSLALGPWFMRYKLIRV